MTPEVLYEDAAIAVVNKPAGMLSVPGIGPDNQDCMARRIAAGRPGARIVHRLDRDTSGVMVIALDAESHRALGRQFETRQVRKAYTAVVAGHVACGAGTIDLPMRKDMEAPGPRHIVDPQRGRPALTRYRVAARLDDRTRLELRPITGRSHQLRVHLHAIGHPILGDDIYAPPQVRAMSDRLMLHAVELTFAHPKSGEVMTFVAKCPFQNHPVHITPRP